MFWFVFNDSQLNQYALLSVYFQIRATIQYSILLCKEIHKPLTISDKCSEEYGPDEHQQNFSSAIVCYAFLH